MKRKKTPLLRELTAIKAVFVLVFSLLYVHAAPLIIDHTSVDKYQDIPQVWIDEVKKMWASLPGESHSSGYRIGCNLLQAADSKFAVNITESGTPEGATDLHLRFSRATWGDVGSATGWRYGYGEEDWYTSAQAIAQTKAGLAYCNTTGPALAAIGFGWCWDANWHNTPGGTEDPVYHVRWAGSSVGGPEGDLIWGLDAADTALTGNSINMDTYINATQAYIDYCTTNGYSTKVFFTTGAIDGYTGETGYQRYLKYQRIRDYVNASSNGILFDYADILCWSNAGVQNTTNWTDSTAAAHTFPAIHSDNMLDLSGGYAEDGDHIGERGALRLAKAMWYMLARIAGWNSPFGNSLVITVSGAGTVAKNPDQLNYTAGTSVTLTASPAVGFVSWGGDLSGTTNPAVVIMDSSKNITANFTGSSNPLSQVRCFPNPFNLKNGGTVKIDQMTTDCSVSIYNIQGELLMTIKEKDFGNAGYVEWNGKNDKGDFAGMGIYMYCVTDGLGNKKVGKIAVVK